jgi:hypothetical protein
MARIRIQAKRVDPTARRDRYVVLPLDPRDPAIVRAKQLARAAGGGEAPTSRAS